MSDYTDAEREIEQAIIDRHTATQVPVCGTITVTPANRWAAFSDDELGVMDTVLDRADSHGRLTQNGHLVDEIQAEIERRKA